ncbi:MULTISPECIES: MarR family winged helix-turn-helix transcriptional regulator [Burkholderia]|uniref:Transcriptional regulator, MarR family n=1 Tax=Burkholderia orbicola (strain MC0-3) TaxID=406425 RepID=B1KCS3_BURO0|nr:MULTISPECIES: MarR family transcriptional regulator [Burkholderia]ACA96020.1 transcriptional regulator, MarR family [Burkholderia orbicola MC0-3]KWU23716.1 MarR family transcriptional regulator [Burkholderia cenocepacia]MBY4798512.1 MarR family transcriptional regulator [Burkholderia cepacia]MCA8088096.1 MarR family transcriptional regulator [Burkholderia cenocepacia]RQV54380.1 MarR family transcriptional regulator [Burkholderia cenocepacia]
MNLADAPSLIDGIAGTEPARALTPEDYRTEESVAFKMNLVHLLLGSEIDRKLSASGLSALQWGILKALYDERARTPTALCRILLADSGAMTRKLDSLERRGLIERIRSISDRRSIELVLKASGRQLLRETLPHIVETSNRQLLGFSVDEVATVKRLLDRMVVNLS